MAVRTFARYMSLLSADNEPRKFTLFCPFGGAGGGALGGQRARAKLFGMLAAVRLIGGIDNVPRACRDFEYLTGVPETCMDVATMTTADMRAIVGDEPPDIVFSSPPCKSSSKLLPAKRAAEPKYQAMSELALVITRLLLTTWDRPPPLLIFENVPSITSRAKARLAKVRKLLREHGYSIQDGFHDCGEIAALGQRRKRWFFVARHEKQVPFFLYKPPQKGIRSCGSVLRELPMPNDPLGGPMHELPDISAINHARLWAIPAGGDWRDLIRDATPRRKRFRRQHVERWVDPSVTIAGSGSNGPYAVQEIRGSLPPPFEATGMLVQLGEGDAERVAVGPTGGGFPGAWGVLDPEDPAGAVTGNARISTGAYSIADTKVRFKGSLGVLDPAEPAQSVTGEAYPSTGPFSIADDRPPSLTPQAGNADMHFGKYQVLDPTQPAPPVIGATRVGSGAPSIADVSLLVPKKPAYDRAYGVLDPAQPSPTVAGTTAVGCGAYAYPSVLPIGCEARAGSYGVLDPDEQAKTIIAHMRIDNSPAAIAARALPPGYGVLSCEEAKKIATGEIHAPFMVVDRSDPTRPLAFVDRLDRPPYRLEHVPSKRPRGKPKLKKVLVPLVMISPDGTWHRPLTTLELASLQGLPWIHKGAPLCFEGGSTHQREAVGNMVPPPAAMVIIEQMLLCLLAAASGCFYLDSGGAGVWCQPEAQKERLEREGVRIIHGNGPWMLGGGVKVLDDGAVIRTKPRGPKAKPLARSRPARHPHMESLT